MVFNKWIMVKLRCAVKGCPTTTLPEEEWGSLFCFPLNDDVRKQWLRNLNLEELTVLTTKELTNRGYRVCHRHFEELQFQNHLKKRLNFNIVPPAINSAPRAPKQEDAICNIIELII